MNVKNRLDNEIVEQIREDLLVNFDRAVLLGFQYAEYGNTVYQVNNYDRIELISYPFGLDKNGRLEIPVGFDALNNVRLFRDISKKVIEIDLGSLKTLPVQALSIFSNLKRVYGEYLEIIPSYCFKDLDIDEIYFPRLKTINYSGLSGCNMHKVVFAEYELEADRNLYSALTTKEMIDRFSVFGMSLI